MKLDYFPFYIDEFEGGTKDMSCEEIGAYVQLLMYQSKNGSIPTDDPERLKRITSNPLKPIDYVLKKFPNGVNEKMFKVVQRISEKSDKAKDNVNKRWHKDGNAIEHTDVSPETYGRNTDVILSESLNLKSESLNIKTKSLNKIHSAFSVEKASRVEGVDIFLFDPRQAFKEIWGSYPKRDGKKSAERHFNASVKDLDDFEDMKKALANYLQTDTVKRGYIKNGSTWFNNWRDWIDYKGNGSAQVGVSNIVSIANSLKEFENGQNIG